MNKQYDCNIILDLLPLSIENMVTEETQEVIDQHLLTCESCRQIYEDMTRELDITSTKKKRKKKKKHKFGGFANEIQANRQAGIFCGFHFDSGSYIYSLFRS